MTSDGTEGYLNTAANVAHIITCFSKDKCSIAFTPYLHNSKRSVSVMYCFSEFGLRFFNQEFKVFILSEVLKITYIRYRSQIYNENFKWQRIIMLNFTTH